MCICVYVYMCICVYVCVSGEICVLFWALAENDFY